MKAGGIELVVTDQDIDDIMSTALDGAIAYWCMRAEVVGNYLGEYASDQISRGGSLTLYCFGEKKGYELTKEKFLEGVQKIVNEGPGMVFVYREADKLLLECGAIDGEAADLIIQYALFGEEVYG